MRNTCIESSISLSWGESARRLPWKDIVFFGYLVAISILALYSCVAFGASQLPGEDASSRMESAGTLLRFIDTGIFRWGARILAGLCIFGSAWSLKEGRYGPAIISVISAILFGTAPTWVKNIFSIGGSDSVFSEVRPVRMDEKAYAEVRTRAEDSRHA